MQLNEVLSLFKGVRKLKNYSYQAMCPCHDDKKTSLTITLKGNKILIHCHAGCSIDDICSTVGIKKSDLFLNPLPQREKPQYDNGIEAIYKYNGYVKIRKKNKAITYGVINGNQIIYGMPEGIKKHLYKIDTLPEAIKKGFPIYYAEGEKDVDNLVNRWHLTATTAGGCGDWRKEFALQLKGARVIILADNDKKGQELAQRVAEDIKDIAYCWKVFTPSKKDKGDISDFISEGGSYKEFKEMLAQVSWEYSSWVKLKENNKGNISPSGINSDNLAFSIAQSLDYVIINKSGLDVADFHIYKKGVYSKCSKNEMKGYIKEYLPLGIATDSLLNNTYNLLLCSPENTYNIDDVNSNEYIINLKNGIYDLRTESLIEHSPKILSTLQLNCRYDLQAEAPVWNSYINTLCSDIDGVVDSSKIALLQEWAGLALSNIDISRVKKCLVLTSPLGNTGKSVFLSVLGQLVGIENTINIPIQKMADRFALSDLCGKRIDLVGDQTSEDILDSSGFKQLTGGDSVKIEFKGKQAFNYRYKGAIIVSCNSMPTFTDDKGGHIFERLSIVPCERVIPKEERDSSLIHKLTAEADGIFMWALEGLNRLIKNGFRFTECRAEEKTIETYRTKVDTLYNYVNECYIITGNNADRVKKSEFEDGYARWCKDNENVSIPLKKKNIAERAAQIGIPLIKSNNCYYVGIVSDFKENVEEEIPFA